MRDGLNSSFFLGLICIFSLLVWFFIFLRVGKALFSLFNAGELRGGEPVGAGSESFFIKPFAVISFCITVGALFYFFTSAEQASNFPVSDSIEYSVAAERVVDIGTYSIELEGITYPPRYSPWYPLFVLVPFYYAGDDIGSGIYATTVYALLACLLALVLGSLIGGPWGAVLAAVFLLFIPGFRYFAKQILTDVPFSAIAILLWFEFLLLKNEVFNKSKRSFLSASFLAAWAAILRPFGFSLLLPFLVLAFKKPKTFQKIFALAVLALPTLIVFLATAYYNLKVFGTATRSGYNFWLAVPYDYPSLILSVKYFASNISVLISDTEILPLVLVTITIFIFLKRKAASESLSGESVKLISDSVIYAVLGLGPIVVFHLFYFYPSVRFFLPLQVFMAIITGALAGRLFSSMKLKANGAIMLALLTMVLLVIVSFLPMKEEEGLRARVELLNKYLPDDAVLVSDINPLYLQALLVENSKRKIVPWSRETEYASKVVSWQKYGNLDLSTTSPYNHRAKGLIENGAISPILQVADENPLLLSEFIRNGRSVYIDTTRISYDSFKNLSVTYFFEGIAPDLYWVHHVDEINKPEAKP